MENEEKRIMEAKKKLLKKEKVPKILFNSLDVSRNARLLRPTTESTARKD